MQRLDYGLEKCFIAASYHKIRLSVETGGTILRLNLRITSSNFHTQTGSKIEWEVRHGLLSPIDANSILRCH